jgi:hypothetical protein
MTYINDVPFFHHFSCPKTRVQSRGGAVRGRLLPAVKVTRRFGPSKLARKYSKKPLKPQCGFSTGSRATATSVCQQIRERFRLNPRITLTNRHATSRPVGTLRCSSGVSRLAASIPRLRAILGVTSVRSAPVSSRPSTRTAPTGPQSVSGTIGRWMLGPTWV